MFFKCGRPGCQFEAATSTSVKLHQAKRKRQSNFSMISQYKYNGAYGRCKGQGILCVNDISNSGKCLPQATVFHETPNTSRLPSPAPSMLAASLEDCDDADVDAHSWTHNGQEAGASTNAGVYKPPALPVALALCSRVTEDQEKRWNTDEEHSEFMRFFLCVLPGCAPLSPQAGKILTEEDMDAVLNPKQDGLREQTRTEKTFYNFVTQHRLSRAWSNSLMQMLRHDFFFPVTCIIRGSKSGSMRRRAIQNSP